MFINESKTLTDNQVKELNQMINQCCTDKEEKEFILNLPVMMRLSRVKKILKQWKKEESKDKELHRLIDIFLERMTY